MDPRVDALYRLVGGRIQWENLVPTLMEAAQELEQMRDLKGPERLTLLQDTLRVALSKSEMPQAKKETLSFFITTVVPIIVQGIIAASKVPIRKARCFC